MDPKTLSSLIRAELDRQGLNPFRAAMKAGLPENAFRTVLGGHEPKVGRLAEICELLGLEFYVGPPRGDSDSAGAEETAAEEPEPAAEAPPAWAVELRAGLQSLREEIRQEIRQEVAELLGRPEPPISEDVEEADERNLARRYPNVRLAAGAGAIPDREDLVEPLSLPSDWLQAHGLNIRHVCLVNVWGDSMVPTLNDGDGVFVNLARTQPRSGRIYALRTTDGTVVKRLRKRQGQWWAVSDNPEVDPHLIEEGDEVIGEIAGRADPEKHDVG